MNQFAAQSEGRRTQMSKVMKRAVWLTTIATIGLLWLACSSSDAPDKGPQADAATLPTSVTSDVGCDGVGEECYSYTYDSTSVANALIVQGSADAKCDGTTDAQGCTRVDYDANGNVVKVSSSAACADDWQATDCYAYSFDGAARLATVRFGCDGEDPVCTSFDYDSNPGKVALQSDLGCTGENVSPVVLATYRSGSPRPPSARDLFFSGYDTDYYGDVLTSQIDSGGGTPICLAWERDSFGNPVQQVMDELCDGNAMTRSACMAYGYDDRGRMLTEREVDCDTGQPKTGEAGQVIATCTSFGYPDPRPEASTSGPPADFDPGGPPPGPRAAVTATFGNPADNVCPAAYPTPTLEIGAVSASSYDPVTDGVDGANVECSVAESAGSFLVQGSVQQGSNSVTVDAQLTATGGTGAVSLRGSSTAGTYRPATGTSCVFQVVEVTNGKVWASFNCPLVERPGMPNSDCSVEDGVIVFENCAQ